jgi:hypothetical protein
VRPSEPSFERPDIWHLEGSAGTMVFPASVAQALEPHLSESGDLLPLSFEGSDEPFYALDITRIVDCLDAEKSTIGVLSLRLSFHSPQLPEPGLFKVPELATSDLFSSSKVISAKRSGVASRAWLSGACSLNPFGTR